MATDATARHPAQHTPQHGLDRLDWCNWFRCESSFSLLLVPDSSGIFAVAEQVIAPGESAAGGGKRLLAVLQFAEADNLARALSRLFTPVSPLYHRITGGECFLRYAVVEDATARANAASALQGWLAASAETAAPAGRRSARQVHSPGPLPAGF